MVICIAGVATRRTMMGQLQTMRTSHIFLMILGQNAKTQIQKMLSSTPKQKSVAFHKLAFSPYLFSLVHMNIYTCVMQREKNK